MNKVDKETTNYIIQYFPELLTTQERIAIRHAIYTEKFENSAWPDDIWFREKGLITSDQTILDLLKDGYDIFEQRVISRILSEAKDRIFFNNCPKCGKLARTPAAKQCRHCGDNWRDQTS